MLFKLDSWSILALATQVCQKSATRAILDYMDTPQQPLPIATEQFLQNHDGPMTVNGQQGKYVLMRAEVFDAMLGVSENEDAETLASVMRGIGDLEAGRTHDVDEAFEKLNTRHGS